MRVRGVTSADFWPASGSEQVGPEMSSAAVVTSLATDWERADIPITLGDLLTVIGEGLRTTGRRQVATPAARA